MMEQGLLVIICIISISSSQIIEAYHIGENLEKSVSSSDILNRYENGQCIYPGFCNINVDKCNIPKIPLSSITYDSFIENYM